jgi:hypothetical protein
VITLGNEGGSFQTTCSTVTGEATVEGETFSEITIGNIKGTGCSVLGQVAELRMNGCHYLLAAAGTLTINCPAGKEIEAGNLQCLYYVPPQGPLSGVTYTNLGSGEVTVAMQVKNIMATATLGCGGAYGTVTAEFTTGNTILTAETDPGGEKATLSFE